MSDSPTQTVSLNEMGQRYLGALQTLCDLTVLSWAGAKLVKESDYEQTFRSMAGLPSTPFRLPFETAVAEAARWGLKNCLAEVLGLCFVFLEDIRKVCGLIAFNAAKAKASGDLAALAAEVNTPFAAPDIAGRFQQLKSRYALAIPLEAELLSVVALHRQLLQNGGTPGVPLTLHLKAVQPPVEGTAEPRLEDYQRTWQSGERVSLERQEHAAIFTTVSVFLSATLAAVQEFAKISGLPENPSAQ